VSHCCESLKNEMSREGGDYPQIELVDGLLYVNGCCGGGCYVLTKLRYCPYCGYDVTSKIHSLGSECVGEDQ